MSKRKHPGGRPSEYPKRNWSKLIKEYLDDCIDEYRVVGKSKKGWPSVRSVVNLPSIEGLADFLDISKETIYQWASENKQEFSDAIRIIKARQAKQLINKGLSGEYNPVIAKLLLSANHDMAEKTETTVKVPPERKKAIEKALDDL